MCIKANYSPVAPAAYLLLLDIAAAYKDHDAFIQQVIAQRQLLTTQEVANTYLVSKRTVYRLNKAGLLPATVKKKHYYFDGAMVAAFFSTAWRKVGAEKV